MNASVFDPQAQVGSPDLKIIAALERLSEGFRVLLWEKAKIHGISPIQIQILIFLKFHLGERCKVGQLALEFNLSKPTISEAVKTLEQKGLIFRQVENRDSRSHNIHLSEAGKIMVEELAFFADPMLQGLAAIPHGEKGVLLQQLLELIGHLQQAGIVSLQRMCFACRFYKRNDGGHYCQFLDKTLENVALRVDCPEFVAA
jgi:DNA-binding MarR family transcriptional regulator